MPMHQWRLQLKKEEGAKHKSGIGIIAEKRWQYQSERNITSFHSESVAANSLDKMISCWYALKSSTKDCFSPVATLDENLVTTNIGHG